MAWFHNSRSCIGAPTILLRPITTARFPASDTPARKQQAEERGICIVVCISGLAERSNSLKLHPLGYAWAHLIEPLNGNCSWQCAVIFSLIQIWQQHSSVVCQIYTAFICHFTQGLEGCDLALLTSLSDQFHTSIWSAWDEAVTQVSTRQLPSIYACKPENRCKTQTHSVSTTSTQHSGRLQRSTAHP